MDLPSSNSFTSLAIFFSSARMALSSSRDRASPLSSTLLRFPKHMAAVLSVGHSRAVYSAFPGATAMRYQHPKRGTRLGRMTEPSGCRSSGSVLGELRDGRHWTRVKGSVAFSASKKQTHLSSGNRSGRWCRLWSTKYAGSRGKGITEVESRESRAAGAETNRDGTGCPGRLWFRGRGGETGEGREPWVRRSGKAGMGIRTRGSTFGEDGEDTGGPAATKKTSKLSTVEIWR